MENDFQSSRQDKYKTGFHKTPLDISWLWLVNFAVIFAALRWYKYSFYLHLLLSIAIITLTLLSTIHILVDDWLSPNDKVFVQKIHNYAGLIVTIWLGLQALSGILSRVAQYPSRLGARTCKVIKKFHQYSGYLIMLLSKFDYFNIRWIRGKYNEFVIYMMIELVFLVFYLWLKSSFWTLGEDIVDGQLIGPAKEEKNNMIQHFLAWIKSKINNVKNEFHQKSHIILPITKKLDILISQKEISIQNYVLFNDFVYDISKLKYLHPGGQKVIDLMRNRQVNRFMYGFYKLEDDYNAPIHNHSKQSMRLCGQPIAKIERISPIKGFNDLSKFTIAESRRINKGTAVHVVFLRPDPRQKSQSVKLHYEGYKCESQIGQHFSLTICDKKGRKRCTRLFTTAWCVRPANIDFMERHSPNSTKLIIPSFDPEKYLGNSSFSITESLLQTELNPSMSEFDRKQEIITLVMKKYKKGQLTSRLLGNKFQGEIILSAPMGSGMNYQDLRDDGKVIIVSGGTGILPFCDLIDLLFKRVKYLQNPNYISQIANYDQLITKDLIKKKKFILYYAAESSYDTIPMIFYQLNYLRSALKYIDFEVVLKIKRDSQLMKNEFKLFKYQTHSFNDQIETHLRNERDQINKIYVCGPFKMNEQILKIFKKQNVHEDFYCFM